MNSGYKGIFATHKYWGKKPPELCSKIIDALSLPEDLVVDPFMGSGVLARVCFDKGRNFIGSDINPVALSIARMFTNPPSAAFAQDVFNRIRCHAEKNIKELYLDLEGNEVTHIIRTMNKPEELWIANGNKLRLGDIELWDDEKSFDTDSVPFFEHKLFENSRINVEKNQTIAALFTPRAIVAIKVLKNAIADLDAKQQWVGNYILTSSLGQMSKMVFAIKRRNQSNSACDKRKYEVGSWVIGYWRPKLNIEVNAWRVFEGRANKLIKALIDNDFSGDLFNPVKTTPAVKLMESDGFRLMKEMSDNVVDLVITDPPHNDRIPYLELSAMWNSVLEKSADYGNEWVISDAPARKKNSEDFFNKLRNFMNECARILKDNGKLVLMYNTTDPTFWELIQRLDKSEENTLSYIGKFYAEYSARSVVQDCRKGALKHDWCLVFVKNPSTNISGLGLPGWSSEW